ncbi:MAG: phosphate acyltransferase PlsX [Candidatus Omnitrophota bacterium]
MSGKKYKIAIDGMGGDNAPAIVVDGVCRAALMVDAELILVGDKNAILEKLSEHRHVPENISIVPASEVIEMHEPPAQSIRRKKDSSINVAVNLVKNNQADAFISAGNTGAVVCAASLFLKQLNGIERPGIMVVMPTLKGPAVIIDAGANIGPKPKHLLNYGIMGSVYMKYILKKEDPKVGLLNIGEEASKGTDFVKETFKLLEQAPINFIGNMEGRDIFAGKCDVIVCDGFVGNIVLKVSEGVADAIKQMFKQRISNNYFAKLGLLFSKSALSALKKDIDYAEYGGAPLLGINSVGIISHGGSSSKAVKNAVRVAYETLENKVNQHIVEEMTKVEYMNNG